MDDPFELERFVAAQAQGGTYEAALAELRAGRKRSHWMWFVFPQIAGLGQSPISRRYAISSLAEAKAYLAHEVLGPRLIECARVVRDLGAPSAEETAPSAEETAPTAEDVFGGIDAMKLRSSMTLFARADPENPLFGEVLDAYFGGRSDDATDRLIQANG